MGSHGELERITSRRLAWTGVLAAVVGVSLMVTGAVSKHPSLIPIGAVLFTAGGSFLAMAAANSWLIRLERRGHAPSAKTKIVTGSVGSLLLGVVLTLIGWFLDWWPLAVWAGGAAVGIGLGAIGALSDYEKTGAGGQPGNTG